MKHVFHPDSQLMQSLGKLADLILLNLYTILCSVLLITVGPAMTALYDVAGKIIRKDEVANFAYWRAIKSNWKQAMILWLVLLIPGLAVAYAWILVTSKNTVDDIWLMSALCIASILYLGITAWVFPLQSRFINPVGQTIRNAVYCAVMYFPCTILMVLVDAFPWWCLLFQMEMFIALTPVWIGLWFAVSALLNMWILRKPFQNIEKLATTMDWRTE